MNFVLIHKVRRTQYNLGATMLEACAYAREQETVAALNQVVCVLSTRYPRSAQLSPKTKQKLRENVDIFKK